MIYENLKHLSLFLPRKPLDLGALSNNALNALWQYLLWRLDASFYQQLLALAGQNHFDNLVFLNGREGALVIRGIRPLQVCI